MYTQLRQKRLKRKKR